MADRDTFARTDEYWSAVGASSGHKVEITTGPVSVSDTVMGMAPGIRRSAGPDKRLNPYAMMRVPRMGNQYNPIEIDDDALSRRAARMAPNGRQNPKHRPAR